MDGTVLYLPRAMVTTIDTSTILDSISFIVTSKYATWQQAMNIEYDALLHNKTWSWLQMGLPPQALL